MKESNSKGMNNAQFLPPTFLSKNNTCTAMSEVTGKSQRTISRELKEYQEAGLLRREGSRKAGHWVVE